MSAFSASFLMALMLKPIFRSRGSRWMIFASSSSPTPVKFRISSTLSSLSSEM